jgi:hypothetical protein
MLNIDKDKTIMARGLQGQTAQTRQQSTAQDQYNYASLKDWRVRISLAPNSSGYMYKSPNPGIMAPLADTDGVIFPYTPNIQVQYSANYDPTELTHSNYKIFQYRSSAVDSISITGDFTAQDTYEANYMLAAIHFFKSMTKMFYGNDQDPVNGTPPPLCYIYGLGEFQFNRHPMAITGFNYNLPNDVDYIRASETPLAGNTNNQASGARFSEDITNIRTASSGIAQGALPLPPQWTQNSGNANASGSPEPTYVPTRLQIQVNAIPIVSRYDISQVFSLRDYANGSLLQGNKIGGGMW